MLCFMLRKHIAHLAICSNPPLMRDKPLGASAIVRRAYCPIPCVLEKTLVHYMCLKSAILQWLLHFGRLIFSNGEVGGESNWRLMKSTLSSFLILSSSSLVLSNRQPHDCLTNLLFRRRSRKHQSSASLAFMRGIHRWPMNSPQRASNAESVSISRHHAYLFVQHQ